MFVTCLSCNYAFAQQLLLVSVSFGHLRHKDRLFHLAAPTPTDIDGLGTAIRLQRVGIRHYQGVAARQDRTKKHKVEGVQVNAPI